MNTDSSNDAAAAATTTTDDAEEASHPNEDTTNSSEEECPPSESNQVMTDSHSRELADIRAALTQRTAELEALQSKFSDWKHRAKTGVEQQRASIRDLEARLAQAKADAERAQGRFDSVLRLKDGEVRSLREQIESHEMESRANVLEVQNLQRALSGKDGEIARVCESMQAVQFELDRALSSHVHVHDQIAQAREEAENRIFEEMEVKLGHMQQLHEAELAAVTSAIGLETQASTRRKDQKIAELTSLLEDATSGVERLGEELAAMRAERDALKKVTTPHHGRSNNNNNGVSNRNHTHRNDDDDVGTDDDHSNAGTSGSSSTLRSLSDENAQLRKRVAMQAEQLWTLGNEVARLKSALDARPATPPSLSSSGGGGRAAMAAVADPASVNSDYLRSVLVKFLSERNDDVRSNILPVLATMLSFTTQDLKAIFPANPQWVA